MIPTAIIYVSSLALTAVLVVEFVAMTRLLDSAKDRREPALDPFSTPVTDYESPTRLDVGATIPHFRVLVKHPTTRELTSHSLLGAPFLLVLMVHRDLTRWERPILSNFIRRLSGLADESIPTLVVFPPATLPRFPEGCRSLLGLDEASHVWLCTDNHGVVWDAVGVRRTPCVVQVGESLKRRARRAVQ